MELGTARVIQTHKNLLHIVKLDSYERTIDRISESLDTLTNFDELKDSINITKIKLQNVKQKLKTLKPNIRNKRGLVNGLGSFIKIITGNMDARDADRLNKEIDGLKQSQINFNTDLNKQILINHKMIERFENITDHINNQQHSIIGYLKNYQSQFGNKIKLNRDITRHMQYLNQINYNIDLLTNHLSDIAEAIILARLKIISKQILNEEEMVEIYNSLKIQIIDIKSDEQIYEMLELQAYYMKTDIIFNIKIPILSQESYYMAHIIPLPINNTKTLHTKPFIIHNQRKIQYFDEACRKMGKTFYCEESLYQEEIKDSHCIGNLLQHKPAECRLIEGTHISDILQPEPNYVLLVNVPVTEINSSCEVKNLKINGTKLIHFENCSLEINNIIYEDHLSSHWDEIYIYPLVPTEINYTLTTMDVKLQDLQTYHFGNQQSIEILKMNTTQSNDLLIKIILANGIVTSLVIAYLLNKKIRERNNQRRQKTIQHPGSTNHDTPAEAPEDVASH